MAKKAGYRLIRLTLQMHVIKEHCLHAEFEILTRKDYLRLCDILFELNNLHEIVDILTDRMACHSLLQMV